MRNILGYFKNMIYEELKTIRNNYLQLLRAAMCVDNVQEYFGDFFQEVKDEFNKINN